MSDPRHDPTTASPAHDAGAGIDPLREGPGTRIGPYQLVRQIGEGGFGSVFLAEQEVPVRREVALKIIKLGMDTRQVVARFEQERQALAVMEHPNIARVIDAGATATGRPYFVMELVKGDPITVYCDHHKLTIDERLELFAQVCTAVQHAHTKGIIHRDLKPSNVLVFTQDDRPLAKVIDFGIAKATSAKLTDKTLFTEQRQVIGTLQYMSPEQAEGSIDIDTRTDVYSLGVLLYELLTGSTPFDAETLRRAMFSQAQRMIREIDPPKPSTRLHHSTDTLATIAARRRVEPKRLGGIVRGELDWIVMKAIEKDRSRRYDSAHGFAADIRRYLSGEPVTAAPPSAAYRFKKVVQRHKVAVAAGSLVVLAILVGSTLAVTGFVQASRQRDAAVAAEARAVAETARATGAEARAVGEAQRAVSAEARAVDEARSATQIADFLAHMLEGIGPQVALGRDTTLMREIVDNTAQEVEKELAEKPLVASRLLRIIGSVYNQLAVYDKAEAAARRSVELLRAAPGDNRVEIARSLFHLAQVLESGEKFDEAMAMFQESYDLFCAAGVGETDDALLAMSGVGGVFYRKGDAAAAGPILRKVVEGQRALTQGKDSQHLASALERLSIAIRRQPDASAESDALIHEALAMRRHLLGEFHPDIALSLSNLATLLAQEGRFVEAIEFGEQSLEQHRKLFGERHPRTASAEIAHAWNLESAGRISDAIKLRRHALDVLVEKMGANNRSTLDCNFRLGALLEKTEDFAGAEEQYRAMLAWGRANYAPGDNRTTAVIMLVANAVMHQHRYADAEALYREALHGRSANQPAGHPKVIETENALADCLVAQDRHADAEPLLLAVEESTAALSASAAPHVDAMKRLVALYTAWNAAEAADKYGARIAEWQGKLDLLK